MQPFKWLTILGFFLSFVCIHLACGEKKSSANQTCQLDIQILTQTEKIFHVCAEVADTPEERALGLMYRKNLAPDSGMLFIFETDTQGAFWMKNTYIPLDIFWVNSDRKIIGISENTTPLDTSSIHPPAPYRYVLELNAFYAREHGVTLGDELSW